MTAPEVDSGYSIATAAPRAEGVAAAVAAAVAAVAVLARATAAAKAAALGATSHHKRAPARSNIKQKSPAANKEPNT